MKKDGGHRCDCRLHMFIGLMPEGRLLLQLPLRQLL